MDDTERQAKLATVTAEAAATVEALSRFPIVVESYLELSGVQQTKFGKETGGGIDFVRHMRGKRDLRSSTINRVLAHIAAQAVFT